MVLQRFFRPVAVVVGQLDTRREIIFRYKHEMGTICDHYGLRHKIAIARMIHEAAQLAGFGSCVNATDEKSSNIVKTSFQ